MVEKKQPAKKPTATKQVKASAEKKAPVKRAAAKKPAAQKPTAGTRPAPERATSEVAAAAPRADYLKGLGRRKESVALVRLFKNGSGKITVNEKDFVAYFPVFELQQIVQSPTKTVGQSDKLDISVRVAGGGIRGQADAVRLGISRALIGLNPTYRRSLKKVGFLTRDARVKERKKYGLKRARRAPQFAKR